MRRPFKQDTPTKQRKWRSHWHCKTRAHSKIYTDSKTAARTFAAGLLARSTAKLTDNAIREYESKETLIEEGKAQIQILRPGSQRTWVNRLARELTRRAADNDAYEGERHEDLSCKDQALTYHEITSHYRVQRRTFPAPPPKLNKAQALTLRRQQTRTYITPSTLHRVDPDTPPTCSLCDHPYCNFEHMLWLCPTPYPQHNATQHPRGLAGSHHEQLLQDTTTGGPEGPGYRYKPSAASAVLGGATRLT
ncbi:hypothetical protein HPB50_025332 [Hyalomma asiaticum]|uniref:Uncharacterized protein n=1 Tax=Hyalomma asiaticum TaxID=266040 RepID=A0ACB7SQD0_HYAAI|nr:hypothetical protein HPB50_025332 [Hyalomma asiaticum]